jgi:hypothetical protein
VSLTSPTGGESWTSGSVQTIIWSAEAGNPPYTVNLRYSTDGGTSFPNVIASDITQSDPGTNSHDWTVPELDSRTVKVLVEVTDAQAQDSTRSNPTDFEIDTLPPSVEITFPVDSATDVPTNTPLIITFDEGMDHASADAVSIAGPGSPTLSSSTWVGTQLTLQTVGLEKDSSYTITISTSARDDSNPGNSLESAYEFTFKTGSGAALPPPTVVSTSPEHGEMKVAVDSQMSIRFSKAMDRETTISVLTASPALSWQPSWASVDSLLTLTPDAGMLPYTEYTITIGTTAKSADGVNLASQYAFSFTTGAIPDTKAPRVVGTSPFDGQGNVDLSRGISITFSEPMDTEATQEAVSLLGITVDQFSWSNGDRTLTISASLLRDRAYTVTVSEGAQDPAGNALDSSHSFTFTTVGEEGTAEDEGVDSTTISILVLVVVIIAVIGIAVPVMRGE